MAERGKPKGKSRLHRRFHVRRTCERCRKPTDYRCDMTLTEELCAELKVMLCWDCSVALHAWFRSADMP